MIDSFLHPLEVAVAWIMVAFHSLFSSLGLPTESGWTWSLSIVGLVIVIRILLIPLFVKQIKASRGLQLIQPEMKKIQEKYKGKTDPVSRQAMTQETMALYRETGTNPFASCLPILLQSPIFFALFRVLNGIESVAEGKKPAIGPLDQALAQSANDAKLLGAQLTDKFIGATTLSTQIVTIVLIVLMSLTTFTTQRQLMRKNMPASALEGPFANQQKYLLYLLPAVFAISGVNFPIGVLLYWLTTNVWSMGQQFYVIRRMPAPGSPAEKALQERRARRGKGAAEDGGDGRPSKGLPGSSRPAGRRGADQEGADVPAPGVHPGAGGQRRQPKRQSRSQRGGPARPKPGSGPVRGEPGRPGTEGAE